MPHIILTHRGHFKGKTFYRWQFLTIEYHTQLEMLIRTWFCWGLSCCMASKEKQMG